MKKWQVFKNSILFPESLTNSAKVAINGKAVNKGKGIEMEVLCTITFWY